MAQRSSPRRRRLNGGFDSLIRRIVKEPVKEAVREALAEERTAPSTPGDDDAGSPRRGRRAIPLVFGFLVAALAVRRWRRSRRAGYESDLDGTAGERKSGGGEPIHVEAAAEE